MNSKKTSIFIASILSLSLMLAACEHIENADPDFSDTSVSLEAIALPKGEDMGEAYIDGFVFLGESTTYHLKSRGVLSGGTETSQVWSTESGTINLDETINTLRIIYPETNESLTIAEAVARKKPERIFLCFGLNGATQKIKRGEEYFKACYRRLLNDIIKSSPSTQIFLASAFPVSENMDMSRYSVSVDTLNKYISTINLWTYELSNEYGAAYLNVSEVLTDSQGRLKLEYQVGDGHHLTKEAYKLILDYIRTHPKDQ